MNIRYSLCPNNMNFWQDKYCRTEGVIEIAQTYEYRHYTNFINLLNKQNSLEAYEPRNILTLHTAVLTKSIREYTTQY
jgi:hypothetical protein